MYVFETKEAVEVIKVSDVILAVEVLETTEVFRTTQVIEIENLMARIILFRCFEKNFFGIE